MAKIVYFVVVLTLFLNDRIHAIHNTAKCQHIFTYFKLGQTELNLEKLGFVFHKGVIFWVMH